MRCLRTLFHEETALLSVRNIPFLEVCPKRTRKGRRLVPTFPAGLNPTFEIIIAGFFVSNRLRYELEDFKRYP
jgi:hypothetical protein